MSYDGHTITVLPGPPCGDTIWGPAHKKISVLGPDGWKTTVDKLMGFCERQQGHSGPHTHLMSEYQR